MLAPSLYPALDGNKLAFQRSAIAYRKIQGYLFMIHFGFYHLEYGALFFQSPINIVVVRGRMEVANVIVLHRAFTQVISLIRLRYPEASPVSVLSNQLKC